MTELKKYPRGTSRQIVSYDRFISDTGTKIFVCLDKGVIGIIRVLLNSRGMWPTTYAKEWLDYGYIIPTDEQMDVVYNAIAEANIDMASCDDIVNAINGVAEQIAAGGASSGCGCVGEGGMDVTEVNDAPTQDIPPFAEWEALGFPSKGAYKNHKCQAAQYIINAYVGTLRNWAGLFGTVGGLTLAVITGLLLLTVPPVGLMLILGALGVLVGTDVGLLVTLSTIATAVEDAADSIRCSLYSAETTEDATQAFRDAVDSIVIDLGLGALEGTFLIIVENLVSNEAMRGLFETTGPTEEEGADCVGCATGDCTPCSDADMYIWTDIGDQGTIVSATPGVNEIVYIVNSGAYQGGTIDLYLSTSIDTADQCNQLVTIEIISGTFTPAAPAGYRTWNALGELTYEGDSPPPTGYPICVSNVSLRSSTSFQARITAEW